MQIVQHEVASIQLVPPGSAPDYDTGNPVNTLIGAIEATELAAEREHYLADRIQYLFPFVSAPLYGPSGGDWQLADPRLQENKNDFQKQNVRAIRLGPTSLVRGYVRAGGWSGPFLRLAYSPTAGSPLAAAKGYYDGETVGLYLKLGAQPGALLSAPYNPETHRYEVELWGGPIGDLGSVLQAKGRRSLERGELISRPDLVVGKLEDFQGPGFDALRDQRKQDGRAFELRSHVPGHSLHPIRPLHLELAWSSADGSVWDSQGGLNYHYEFSMSVRGWSSYLGVGTSANPHGGVGSLEFRNLFSNYFDHEANRRQELGADVLPELGRDLEPWNPDASGAKPPGRARESFMAVNYMDLHMLRPSCAIGIHRHRDNQEAFLMLEGRALMVTGDWCKFPERERAFEVRTLRGGELALIKGGQFHGLVNALDENVMLFMFGGYD